MNKTKDEYSEKDYWEGRVPDELFDEYLEKYGYEYTPQSYRVLTHSKENIKFIDILPN